MHLPGGYLARKHGGATLLGLSVGATGILTLFTPLAAKTHVGVFIALRIAVGFAEVIPPPPPPPSLACTIAMHVDTWMNLLR